MSRLDGIRGAILALALPVEVATLALHELDAIERLLEMRRDVLACALAENTRLYRRNILTSIALATALAMLALTGIVR